MAAARRKSGVRLTEEQATTLLMIFNSGLPLFPDKPELYAKLLKLRRAVNTEKRSEKQFDLWNDFGRPTFG